MTDWRETDFVTVADVIRSAEYEQAEHEQPRALKPVVITIGMIVLLGSIGVGLSL